MTQPDQQPAPVPDQTASTIAAIASLAAGAIHAAAIGVHAEHRPAVLVFTLVAAFQIGWGALTLRRPAQVLALIGLAGHVGAVAGWAVAKREGIGAVAGIDRPEAVQLADGAAAGLAAVAAAGAMACLLGLGARSSRRPLVTAAAAVLAAALTVPAMVSAGEHRHAGSHHEAAGALARVEGHPAAEHDTGHDHPADESADAHAGSSAPPKPYDPELPIDLGGVDGVTPQQQARAENLVAVTLLRLPRYADWATAEAAGYHSIGDSVTGHEHFINPSLLVDGRVLDPDFPESLVYATAGGERRLVAAMYMLEAGSTIDDVPELGGPLTQWHVHDDLCFTTGPKPRVAGLVAPGADCQPPLVNGVRSPMIHVWIIPHECGPFAALEGIAGGQIAEGEERLCDHHHGSA